MDQTKSEKLSYSSSAYVRAHHDEFGRKAVALALLEEAQYVIPKFAAISASAVLRIASGEASASEMLTLVHSVTDYVNAHSYAVRSGAFAEDGKGSSHAGEFMTALDVAPGEIQQAIIDVIRDAQKKGYATKALPFSIIIQAYIPADHAGVIFTRDPRGKREAVIEWRAGRGAEVVGGERVSRIYRNDDARVPAEHFPGEHEVFAVARQIEKFFDAPQDIEWAIARGELHILQSRSVTSLARDAFMTFRIVDDIFRSQSQYYLSRSGIGETFSRCTPLACDLLRHLYQKDGPIERAYQSLGVRAEMTDSLVVFHGALYVDQARELEHFFPALRYVPNNTGMSPRVAHFRGLWKTLANSFRLSRLPLPSASEMRKKIRSHVHHTGEVLPAAALDAKKALRLIDHAYPTIFLINLHAEDAFRRAGQALRTAPLPLATLLSLTVRTEGGKHEELLTADMKEVMLGNSINISDCTPFVSRGREVEPTNEALAWWNACSPEEEARVARWITLAKEYQLLREEGRQFSVLLISILRRALLSHTAFPESIIYFATIKELLEKKVSQKELTERKKDFLHELRGDMPHTISTVPPDCSSVSLGVSPGSATGVVVGDVDALMQGAILLTDRLSPDLAVHIGIVGGIISHEGGLLSHLAILAREAGVPVVVDPRARENVHTGVRVTIDGGKGTIVVHKDK